MHHIIFFFRFTGNEHIHLLTGNGNTKLHIDMTANDTIELEAEYSSFSVGDEGENYRIKQVFLNNVYQSS